MESLERIQKFVVGEEIQNELLKLEEQDKTELDEENEIEYKEMMKLYIVELKEIANNCKPYEIPYNRTHK